MKYLCVCVTTFYDARRRGHLRPVSALPEGGGGGGGRGGDGACPYRPGGVLGG